MKTLLPCRKWRPTSGLLLLALGPWLLPPLPIAAGVVTNCTDADLRAGMAGGGNVTLACNGTIVLTDTITITSDTTLDATAHTIVISGNDAVRLFQVDTNARFAVINLTLARGYEARGAAILNLGGRVELSGVVLWGNRASSGGAICNRGGAVGVTNCIFSDNVAASSDWTGAARGGALCNEGGTVDLQCCTFGNNAAWGLITPQPVGTGAAGGAIHNAGTLRAEACLFVGNAAAGAGGCFWGDSGGAGWGGAIYNQGALIISASTFASNSATGGSGLAGSAGGVVLEQGLPGQDGGNGSDGSGGALLTSGSASLVNCTVAGNRGQGGNGGAGGNGGGGYVHWAGNGGNGGNGGSGIGGIAGPCDLTQCTLVGNTALAGTGAPGGAGGSGQYPGLPGTAGASGGALGTHLAGASANLLLAGNTPGIPDTFSNAMLGSLTNNGGPTPTIALLAGSPAIDAGSPTAAAPTDQRGVPRPFGATADIGAYEYATLLRIRRGPANLLEVSVRDALPGQPCRLLTATSFSGWTCVDTNQASADGVTMFQHECAANEAGRFFRVVMP